MIEICFMLVGAGMTIGIELFCAGVYAFYRVIREDLDAE